MMSTCRRCNLAYDSLPYAPCPRCGTPSEATADSAKGAPHPASVQVTKSPRAATTERSAPDLSIANTTPSFAAPPGSPSAPSAALAASSPPVPSSYLAASEAPAIGTIPLAHYPSPQLALPPTNAYGGYAVAPTHVPHAQGGLAAPQTQPLAHYPQQPVPYPTAQPQTMQPYPGSVQVIIQNQVNVPYPQYPQGPYGQAPYGQAYPLTYAPGAHYPIAPYVRRKDPGVATLLSFFIPGAGQLYNGQVGKGCAFLAVSLINFLLLFVGIGFFTGLVTWIWGMVDAHGSAEKINRGEIAT